MTRLSIEDLKQVKKLAPQTDYDEVVTAIRLVKGYDNSYAQNTEGGITALSLTDNALETLVIGEEAKALEYLYLSGCTALRQVVFETALPSLTHLYLDGCALTDFTIPAGCTALEQIYLQKQTNKLKTLVFQGDCPKLELLDVSNNQLTDFTLPYGFGCLTYIYLNDNQLQSLSLHHGLPALTTLHVKNNHLNELPTILLESAKMTVLYVQGNPMDRMDKNVLSSEGSGNSWGSVQNYFTSLSDGQTEYDQVKLIVLGNSTAGKSSLVYFLKDKVYEKGRASTHGMIPLLWEVEDNFKVAIWDFGGQEYYHNIHHLFFTNKCLYAVLFEQKTNAQGSLSTTIDVYENGIKVSKQENLEHFHYSYWTDNIEYLTQKEADKKPDMFLIQNKMDLAAQVKDKAADFAISVEKASTNEPKYMYGFKDFEAQLLEKLKEIKQNVATSPKWLAIKNKIQLKAKSGKPFLTKEEFIRLAESEKTGISFKNTNQTESELDTLTRTLQRTGVILYYPDIKNEGNDDKAFDLSDKIFISPDWLTDNIYRVLDYSVQKNKGRFTWTHVENAIKNTALSMDAHATFRLEAAEIIALMKNFQLIFELNKELNPTNETVYITPQYLPETSAEPESIDEFKQDVMGNTPTFSLFYPVFMPKSVMARFISTNGIRAVKPCWKQGIKYIDKKTTVLVESDFNNKQIHVWIDDKPAKKDLSKQVFDEFKVLNDTNPNIQISKNAKDWVTIGKLLAHKAENPLIETVKGDWVSINDFSEFLDHDGLGKRLGKEPVATVEKQARAFIESNKTDEAIDTIKKWAETQEDITVLNTITIIKGEWAGLKAEDLKGVAKFFSEDRNAIHNRILDLIGQLNN